MDSAANYRDYRVLLNALPMMIFIVDEDVRIHDLNDYAARVFGLEKAAVLDRRGGEVLHCLHSFDVPEGCGRGPACQSCVIRGSVMSSLRGTSVIRERTKANLLVGAARKDLELLITASPMPGADETLTLLTIEDSTEIAALRDLIPICMKCKKVRDDQRYWHSVESYFHDAIGADFTHGICPSCEKELLREIDRRKPA
jgi:PAS domain-containing protein